MDALLDLEERGWQALSSDNPTSFCEQWLADDALLVVPGRIIDRDQFLAALSSEQPWTAHDIDDARTMPRCAPPTRTSSKATSAVASFGSTPLSTSSLRPTPSSC